MNKLFTNFVITVLIMSLFTSCTHKDIEVHQDNDAILSCNKLTTQIANLIDINDDINSDTGLENKSIASWILWPPIGGYNQINASFERGKLDKRFIHLMKLKQKNNCNITFKERKFIQDKGRFSDIFN